MVGHRSRPRLCALGGRVTGASAARSIVGRSLIFCARGCGIGFA
jgi:hypothetical protein